MSIPIQNQNSGVTAGQAYPAGPTSFVTGQVSYGWINEAWRLFSAQMGPWIVATLLLFAPIVVFYIAYYAFLLTTILPQGFNTPAQPPLGANGLPTGPLSPGSSAAQMNAQMMGLLPLAIGFGIAFVFWAAYLYGGMFRMAVRQVRGVPIEIKDIFRGGPVFGRMLGAMFLLGLAGYALEALCLAPMGLIAWQHGPALATGLAVTAGVILLLVLGFLAYGLLLPVFALIADGVGVVAALKGSAAAMKPRVWAASGFVFVYGLLLYASQLLCGIGTLATVPMLFLVCALAYRDMIGMPNMAPPPGPMYAPTVPGVWPPAPGSWPPPPNVGPAPQWGSTPETLPASPQQYPGFPPQQYSPPPVQQYPSVPPTVYPPAEPEVPDETPPVNPWQPRPSPPPPSLGE